jgi:outer membrane protein assembly factor BamB
MNRRIDMKGYNHTRQTLLVITILLSAVQHCLSDEWPTFRHDNRRSGISREQLVFPLQSVWNYSSILPPKKAWSGAAKWDSFAEISNRKSMRDYDPVFYVSSTGGRLFFGSSVDDAVHCLDAATGKEIWTFFTDGAVRIAPTVSGGKVYFGSDDGFAYCVDHGNGSLVWKKKLGPKDDKLVLCNGQLISRWPCRTGVAVKEGRALFAASLFPWNKSYLYSVDSLTGDLTGENVFETACDSMTMQGPILLSDSIIFIPQGMQSPELFSLETGKHQGGLGKGGNGGCFAILGPQNSLIHGRGQNHGSNGELRVYDRKTKDSIVTIARAVSMVVDNEFAWFNTGNKISAFHRARYLVLNKENSQLSRRRKEIDDAIKKLIKSGKSDDIKKLREEVDRITIRLKQIAQLVEKCFIWKIKIDCPHEIILSGDTIIAGGSDKVIALKASTGEQLWKGSVDGEAHGLAIANGRLFVSTHKGKIYCFNQSNAAL